MIFEKKYQRIRERGTYFVPSVREKGPKVTLATYCVVGADGVLPGFICHTGLAAKNGEQDQATVEVSDMGPPLNVAGQMKADTVSMAELTVDEIRKIKTCIEKHHSEHQATQQLTRNSIPQVYCIFPHSVPLRGRDGRYPRVRFNCSGFIFDAYKQVGIVLLDNETMPEIDLNQIKMAYPRYATLLSHDRFRESMGLVGDGPWRVMLCGYLVNSMNRDVASIRAQPFAAQRGHEMFP
jgi:hypothetical protein